MDKPYVVAFCHQKGGVAKTSTVLGLGACLAELGHFTLLVDLDPSGNLTAGVGMNPARVRRSMADVLLGNESMTAVNQATDFPNLDIIPSNPEMLTASRFLHVRPQYESLLQMAFSRDGISSYDFLLLDCPPSLGALTQAALAACDLVVIPTQCEYYALQALDHVFKAVKTARAKHNPGLRCRLLVTMFDLRGNTHRQVLMELQKRYADVLLDTFIGFDSNIRKSQLAGVPLPYFAPAARATQQYRILASELIAYVETQKDFQPLR